MLSGKYDFTERVKCAFQRRSSSDSQSEEEAQQLQLWAQEMGAGSSRPRLEVGLAHDDYEEARHFAEDQERDRLATVVESGVELLKVI